MVGSPGAAAPRAEAPGVDAVLRSLILGSRGLNLRGKQVSWSMAAGGPQRLCVQRIVRRADGRSLAVSEDPASQRGAVIVEDGVWRRAWDPRARRLTVTRAMPRVAGGAAVARMARLIRRNYAVRVAGQENIGGRLCYRLTFRPVHAMSHPVQIWVDTRTGAVLGHQESDASGQTLSVSYFIGVEYPRVVPVAEVTRRFGRAAAIINHSGSPVLRSIAEVRRRAGFPVAVPLAMPGGYVFAHAEILASGGARVACLHYTDGVANMSVFERRARAPRPPGYRETSAVQHSGSDVVGVSYCLGSMEYMVMGHGEMGGIVAAAHSLDPGREATLVSELSRVYHTSPAVLNQMRGSGLGFDAIAATLWIAERSRIPASAVAALFRDGWSLEDVARRARVDPARVPVVFRHIEPR